MFDASAIIQTGSLLILAAVLFAETGLLVGIIFPGDSLLLAAGFFAAQQNYSIQALLVVAFLAVTLGYHSGYLIGRRAGPRLFKRTDGIFFRHEYLAKTQTFFENHGAKTLLLARYIPIIRTFASFVAGMGRMDMRRFVLYNILGGMLWVGSLCLAGYWLGTAFPDFEHYIKWMLILFAPASLVIALIHVFRHADARRRLKKALAEEWRHYFS
ncbi:MAG: VTT domain-containing protein [Candidatus Saccharimonadales bacterium]